MVRNSREKKKERRIYCFCLRNMNNFSFAVLISGNGSNLQAMIDAIEKNKIDGSICCVLSNSPKAYGLQRAKKVNIPTEILDHTCLCSVLIFSHNQHK